MSLTGISRSAPLSTKALMVALCSTLGHHPPASAAWNGRPLEPSDHSRVGYFDGNYGKGTLIDEDIVITAAHVVFHLARRLDEGYPVSFILSLPGRPYIPLKVERIVMHPEYRHLGNNGAVPADIAVVKVRHALDPKFIEPPYSLADVEPPAGAAGVVVTHPHTSKDSGWIDRWRRVAVEVALAGAKTGLPDDNVVYAPKDRESVFCLHDSGAPVLQRVDGRNILVAVTSSVRLKFLRFDPKCENVAETRFISVSFHHAWSARTVAAIKSPDGSGASRRRDAFREGPAWEGLRSARDPRALFDGRAAD